MTPQEGKDRSSKPVKVKDSYHFTNSILKERQGTIKMKKISFKYNLTNCIMQQYFAILLSSAYIFIFEICSIYLKN